MGRIPRDQAKRLERGLLPLCVTCRISAIIYDSVGRFGTVPRNLRERYHLNAEGRAAV